MPKVVDYAARFQFLREAAFEVVLLDGVAALSRHAIARALGTSIGTVRRMLDDSARLELLAAQEVEARRSEGRWGPMPDAPIDQAVGLLCRLLPDQSGRVAEELVWLRLALTKPGHVTAQPDVHRGSATDSFGDLDLRQRFTLAEKGCLDGSTPPSGKDDRKTDSTMSVTADEETDPLAKVVRRRTQEVDATVAEALHRIGVRAENDAEHRRTRVLVSGLAVEVCSGRLRPEEAVAVVRSHVEGVASVHGSSTR